jgi:Sec-independent protein secretion pathway component TatC
MRKQPKNWLVFSGLAFQIGIVMYLMIFLGAWIQQKWNITSKWPTLITTSIGLIMVILLIIKQANRR